MSEIKKGKKKTETETLEKKKKSGGVEKIESPKSVFVFGHFKNLYLSKCLVYQFWWVDTGPAYSCDAALLLAILFIILTD